MAQASCIECNGKVELIDGEWVCVICGMVQGEEPAMARDIKAEISQNRPYNALAWKPLGGSTKTCHVHRIYKDIHITQGRQINELLKEPVEPALESARNRLISIGLGGNVLAGEMVGKIIRNFYEKIMEANQCWQGFISVQNQLIAEHAIALVLRVLKDKFTPLSYRRAYTRLEVDEKIIHTIAKYGVPNSLRHMFEWSKLKSD